MYLISFLNVLVDALTRWLHVAGVTDAALQCACAACRRPHKPEVWTSISTEHFLSHRCAFPSELSRNLITNFFIITVTRKTSSLF